MAGHYTLFNGMYFSLIYLQSDLKDKQEQAASAAKEFSDIFYVHFDKKRHVRKFCLFLHFHKIYGGFIFSLQLSFVFVSACPYVDDSVNMIT